MSRTTTPYYFYVFLCQGQLLDASVCYDHAIRLFPDDITYRHGRLRCFLALGELESAVASTRHYLDSRLEFYLSLINRSKYD